MPKPASAAVKATAPRASALPGAPARKRGLAATTAAAPLRPCCFKSSVGALAKASLREVPFLLALSSTFKSLRLMPLLSQTKASLFKPCKLSKCVSLALSVPARPKRKPGSLRASCSSSLVMNPSRSLSRTSKLSLRFSIKPSVSTLVTAWAPSSSIRLKSRLNWFNAGAISLAASPALLCNSSADLSISPVTLGSSLDRSRPAWSILSFIWGRCLSAWSARPWAPSTIGLSPALPCDCLLSNSKACSRA
ncbi:MAG: hypothetical protein BWY75_03512 [bacterium ADurb.Bin425]|nr:MAG: hypothetical protein BWY75_03512 [bacterium ADurb.Bin425]